MRVSRSRIDAGGSIDLGEGKKLLAEQRILLPSSPPPPVPVISIDPNAVIPPSAPSAFLASPVSASASEPETPTEEDPVPASDDTVIPAPLRGSGSLVRKEGVAGVRRGARGPRPLPSAAATSPESNA